MKEEMNNEYIEILRKHIPQLDIALHINKSNVEYIEFLENKIKKLENEKEKGKRKRKDLQS
tara:strand:- start:2965 stop:3147 length:183 start_codon:yes stop_codon:yes gene_type:complete